MQENEMKRFIGYGKIRQFKDAVNEVMHGTRYLGVDSDGNHQYDHDILLPTIDVMLSEKIHGTNASVCFNAMDGFWVQSRNNIITPLKDNAGCAFIAEKNKDAWLSIIYDLADHHNINLAHTTITIYYEFCGGNIQRNSAISGLDKRSIIFNYFKATPIDAASGELVEWFETTGLDANGDEINMDNEDSAIYNIMNFATYPVVIDFNEPSNGINEMAKIVNTIESNSPVGTDMGKSGNIGEGVVGSFKYKGNFIRFKVKGEKYSATKVKKLKSVNIEHEQKKIDFANIVCSAGRLEQIYQNVFGIGNEKMDPSMTEAGKFLKLLFTDILSEESELMSDMGLDPRSVRGNINKVAMVWFKQEVNKL